MPGSEPSVQAAPEGTESNGALPEFAAGILEKQPIRGYELRSCLAASDRSAVFKTDDKNMDRTVAVKIMRPYPGRDGAVEEFFSLAGSIARLRCPGVARGLDAGRGDGDFFLAYEFLPGENLAARLARRQTGRLTEKESLKLVADVARILQGLFDLGHHHGHLKPSNIIQGDGGKVALTDIGFAWNLAWKTDDEAFAAAPDFLSPEKIDGELNIDVRGDLYALGVIWRLALLGEPVFAGETPEETLRLHREAKPTPVNKVDPKVSTETSDLIQWLLQKDRDARPRTPREFLRKLNRHPLMANAGEDMDGDDDAEAGEDADVPAADGEATADGAAMNEDVNTRDAVPDAE